ncbi:hypothetical protein [Arachidicoccus sp.]|uniref:hypothetical protein n=1 Tax=Arachidicoccus sp. TaxID=1872624 RepID=UPI003D21EAD9
MCASFNDGLLQILFTMPYLKIEFLNRKQLAHRQTAVSSPKKLTAANILFPQEKDRSA